MYPQQQADGKWLIGYDDSWNEIIVDDIDGIDPSQFHCDDQTPSFSVFTTLNNPRSSTVTSSSQDSFLSPQVPSTSKSSDTLTTLVTQTIGKSTITTTSNSEPTTRPNSPTRGSALEGFTSKTFANISGDMSPPKTTFPTCSTGDLSWTMDPPAEPLPLTWRDNDGDKSGAVIEQMPSADYGPGVRGLSNLGNTCFMNAGLQCLLNNGQLVKYFLDEFRVDGNVRLAPNSLAESFVSLYGIVWSSEPGLSSPIRPTEFKDCLGQFHSQFKDFRQHDCQEFLALLLGTLQEQLNPTASQTSVNDCRSDTSTDDSGTENLSDLGNALSVGVEASRGINVGSGTDSPKSSGSDSSSTSSASSVENGEIFRGDPLPSNVQPFSDPITQSNLLSDDQLTPSRRAPNHTYIPSSSRDVPPWKMMAEVATKLNNEKHDRDSTISQSYASDEDLLKQVKIQNTNVLLDNPDQNNQLTFGSKKFPKPRKADLIVDNMRTCTEGTHRLPLASLDTITSVNSLKRRNNSKSGNLLDSESSMAGGGDLDKQQKKLKTSPVARNEVFAVTKSGTSFGNSGDEILDEGSVEWESYLSRNQSSIVKTFHGQFRSAVQCFKCNHVSVTFEPFMYLPVPLPHALEKQVFVTYVTSQINYGTRPPPPVRYLINVNKFDKMSKIVEGLKEILRKSSVDMFEEDHQIVLAEVKDNTVDRILDEATLVRFTSDINLYAFEIPRSPLCLTIDVGTGTESAETSSLRLTDGFPSITSWNPSVKYSEDDLDILAPDTMYSPNVSPVKAEPESNNSSQDTCLRSRDSGLGYETPPSQADMPTKIDLPDLEPASRLEAFVSDTLKNQEEPMITDCSQCCVCLDNISKEELLTHPCSCTICSSCLDRHAEINALPEPSKNKFLCPTCNRQVAKTDFVTLEKPLSLTTCTIRSMIVPILFRMSTSKESPKGPFKMVCHPILVQVPSTISCNQLHEAVGAVMPFPFPYSLHFVTSDGQKCSKCLSGWSMATTNDCSGCEVAHVGPVTLTPSDNIAVQFDAIYEEESIGDYSQLEVVDHSSVNEKRLSELLTLDDCIRAFHESEILDEDNPWFCPTCRSNQRARKSLSIWRAPDTLMVYLKRFIFHDMMSIKVDDPVSFPLEGLDLSKYTHLGLASNETSDLRSFKYNLDSIVCHSGGVTAGHYTSFAKHCTTGKWLYFNDSNVTHEEPNTTDARAYILFYRKVEDAYPVDITKKGLKEDVVEVIKNATN